MKWWIIHFRFPGFAIWDGAKHGFDELGPGVAGGPLEVGRVVADENVQTPAGIHLSGGPFGCCRG